MGNAFTEVRTFLEIQFFSDLIGLALPPSDPDFRIRSRKEIFCPQRD